VPVSGLTWTSGARYRLRVQATGASPTTIRIRAWREGTVEPQGWAFRATDSTAGLQTAGAVGFRAYLSGTAAGAVAFAFDDLRVLRAR
jgi:hypothetical protein